MYKAVLTSFSFLFTLVSFPLIAGNDSPYTLSIATEIDRSEMYNFNLDFDLRPRAVTLMYDPKLKTFANRKFELSIDTNILTTESDVSGDGYQLILEENKSSCYTDSLSAVQSNLVPGYEDIASVYLDQISGNAADTTGIFTVGTPKTITSFNNSLDDTKQSLHQVLLTFSPIPKAGTDDYITFCSGGFTLSFRLNI